MIDDKTGEISIDGKATGWFATTGEGEEAVDMTPYVKDGVVTLHMPDERCGCPASPLRTLFHPSAG